MRRISLATRVVAPIIIGQILSRTSHPVGALIVAAWNFMTIFLEYFLLWKIYEEVPQLHRLKIKGASSDIIAVKGAQWLSGRVLDSRPKGSGFEPHRCHCVVVLEQDTFILA